MFLANERLPGMTTNMNPSRSLLRLVAILAAGFFVLAACGDDDDSADAGTNDTSTEAASDDGADSGSDGDFATYCEYSTQMTELSGPDALTDDLDANLRAEAPDEIAGDVELTLDAFASGDFSSDDVIEASRALTAFHGEHCM